MSIKLIHCEVKCAPKPNEYMIEEKYQECVARCEGRRQYPDQFVTGDLVASGGIIIGKSSAMTVPALWGGESFGSAFVAASGGDKEPKESKEAKEKPESKPSPEPKKDIDNRGVGNGNRIDIQIFPNGCAGPRK